MADPDPTPPKRPTRPRIAVRLAVIAGILIVGLALIELGLRPFVSLDFVGPSAARHDPYYRKSLKPGFAAVVTSQGISYHLAVNSHGFRGPEPSAPLNGCLLFFGDSMTLGVGVDDEQVYPQLIGRELDREFGPGSIPIVNTAIAGSGQGRWLRFLTRDAAALQPRLIVMQFCANDFADNLVEGLYHTEADGTLRESPIPPQRAVRALQERIEALPIVPYSRIYAVLKQSVRYALERNPPAKHPAAGAHDELTYALTEACLRVCAQNGWPVIAIGAQMRESDERIHRLAALCAAYESEFIIIPASKSLPDLYFPPPNGHWNAGGHALVAERLRTRLEAHPAIRAEESLATTPPQPAP